MPATDAQNVILEIIRQVGGTWTGKTKLFKAFYFAHLYYDKNRPGRLTDWSIARMPEGPGIDNSKVLFDALFDNGLLTEEQVDEGPYPEYQYRLTPKGQGAPSPRDDAVQAIMEAVEFCKDKTATKLSEITHERSRSWKLGKNGDILDIGLDLIPDDEYERGKEDLKHVDQVLGNILPEVSA
jgi:hypothetical protein